MWVVRSGGMFTRSKTILVPWWLVPISSLKHATFENVKKAIYTIPTALKVYDVGSKF